LNSAKNFNSEKVYKDSLNNNYYYLPALFSRYVCSTKRLCFAKSAPDDVTNRANSFFL